MNTSIGENVERKDAWEKVTGSAKYIGDLQKSDVLCACLLTSPHAHARIKKIDPSPALSMEGVRLVLTGEDCSQLFGLLLKDRPLLAREKVRYAGEPVALVVVREEHVAAQAARRIKVEYEPLPAVFAPSKAILPGAPLVHERPDGYTKTQTDVYPEPESNIASRYRIQKGDAARALENCEFVVRRKFRLPPSAHAAMETRAAQARIAADGTVTIETSSQSPYAVRTQLAEAFNLQAGKVRVCVPFVGGGFGGKAPVLLEPLAYLASSRLKGQPVRLALPRELDLEYAPCRIGLEAEISLGADKTGRLCGAELAYWVDCGAYSDSAPYMAKAIAVDCTGPYNIENVACNVACVYTNHTFATSYRGFGHDSFTFCIESSMDALARQIGMDPLEFRAINAIRAGDLSPARVVCDRSNTGDLYACIEKIRSIAVWNGGKAEDLGKDIVRAKGTACFWKSENPPTNAISGALVTCNPDGSFNLHTGVVEIGSGGQTLLAQIFAEKLKIDASLVHVVLPVDTRTSPEHWKTVASMTSYMAGNAVERAAEDIIAQFRRTGALVFGCPEAEVEVAHSRVYWKKKPEQFLQYKDVVAGYRSKEGESIGEPVFGRGGYMLKGLSKLDKTTGEGRPGPSWTVGTQVVEVEADRTEMTYRILSATTVLDAGCVLNPKAMREMIAGGMAMGLSLASREAFEYGENGVLTTRNFRTYKLMHIGAEPEYRVGFIETPEEGAPHGSRKFSEHGIIGMPAALSNALSAAFEMQIDTLPLTPETLWQKAMEGRR
ncbi:MAG: xanthine dehydrogenase family protein molybdopterin-binding subunit [Bacillota bacterium]